MRLLMNCISSLLLFSVITTPLFAAASFSDFSPATTTLPLVTPNTLFTTQNSLFSFGNSVSNASSNSNSSNSDTSGISLGILAGGALLVGGGLWASGAFSAATAVAPAATIAIPTAVLANIKSGLSFGGRITLITPCISYLGPSFWITIIPAPATKQPFYIWAPGTLRGVPPPGLPPVFPPSPNPDPPPYIVGQKILGLADIPYFCCVPPSIPTAPFTCQIPAHPFWIPVPPLLGQRMQWANQSVLPGP